MEELFDYVEPSDQNLPCHSFRIHELLMRACVEVEANCKAILTENGVMLTERANMVGYHRIEASHGLSKYEVAFPTWHGARARRRPFSNWANDAENRSLPWYDAYNLTKHNRATGFAEATFNHLLDAICGLVVMLTAQFRDEDFSNSANLLGVGGSRDGMESAIGGYFRVSYPELPEAERYDFNWRALANEDDPFVNFPYP